MLLSQDLWLDTASKMVTSLVEHFSNDNTTEHFGLCYIFSWKSHLIAVDSSGNFRQKLSFADLEVLTNIFKAKYVATTVNEMNDDEEENAYS